MKDRELKAAQKERNKVDINISTKQNQVRSYGEEKKRKEEEVQSKTERIRDKCGDQKLADKAFDVSIKIDKGKCREYAPWQSTTTTKVRSMNLRRSSANVPCQTNQLND